MAGVVEGYDVEVLQEISSDLYCVICLKLMRNPVQFKCGHGMCYVCFRVLLNRSKLRSGTQCPQCREVVKESQVVSNVMLHRLILSFQVRCENHDNGCKWSGELDRFETHIEDCSKRFEKSSGGHKKLKKKKSKKESPNVASGVQQTVQSDLLLEITEQLSTLNDRLNQIDNKDYSKVNDKTPQSFTYSFVKSVTASRKTKLFALFLFTLSLLSGIQLLANPVWQDTSSALVEPLDLQNLHKAFEQLQSELTKINSLIYAQQNNFFQLHLVSKELQSDLESQKSTFLRFLGLYIHESLNDAHYKKSSIIDYVDAVLSKEMQSVRDLRGQLSFRLAHIKDEAYDKLQSVQKQSLASLSVKNLTRIELSMAFMKTCELLELQFSKRTNVSHKASVHNIENAFNETRKRLAALQKKLNDFGDVSYPDVKKHLLKENTYMDQRLNERLSKETAADYLNIIGDEYKMINTTYTELIRKAIFQYKTDLSYPKRFNIIMEKLKNIDLKNGNYIWKMNSSLLPVLPEKHGYYSEQFTAVPSIAGKTYDSFKFAKLWLLRTSLEHDTWKVTYEQDAAFQVQVNVTILNQFHEEDLQCVETYRYLNKEKSSQLIIDLDIPLNRSELIGRGYIHSENIYIRCLVAHKKN